jgi:hypothetical protein
MRLRALARRWVSVGPAPWPRAPTRSQFRTSPGTRKHHTLVKRPAVLLLGLLCGCGNAFESVDAGEWKPVGSAVIPKSARPAHQPRLTVLKAGQGREIKAGDLVHAQVLLNQTVSTGPGVVPQPHVANLPDVWFWLGTSSQIPGRVAYKSGELIDLGDEELRAVFAGVRSGSRVSVVLGGKPDDPSVNLPRRGFSFSGPSSGIYTRVSDDPVRFGHRPAYEFEIVDVCEGRLFYRAGTLSQFGYIPGWGDRSSPPFARSGTIEWVAIEADCDAPNDLRVESGPAFRAGASTLTISYPRDSRIAAPRGKMALR